MYYVLKDSCNGSQIKTPALPFQFMLWLAEITTTGTSTVNYPSSIKQPPQLYPHHRTVKQAATEYMSMFLWSGTRAPPRIHNSLNRSPGNCVSGNIDINVHLLSWALPGQHPEEPSRGYATN